MQDGVNPAVLISGSDCNIQEEHNTFDTSSSYGENTISITSSTSTYQNMTSTSLPEDLNVYTVNPNRPLVGRNFHTIQSAITAFRTLIEEQILCNILSRMKNKYFVTH